MSMIQGTSISGRKENDGIDFYETPKWCIEKLLEKEKFSENILEPCSGAGAISKVLEKHGYNVFSEDIRTDDGVYGNKGQDFLLYNKPKVGDIITNPPYFIAKEFINIALKNTDGKIAMFLKLQFLESADRYEWFKSTPLKKIYVLSKRPTLYPSNGPIPKNKGTIAYAWYIWEKGYKGNPELDWIL